MGKILHQWQAHLLEEFEEIADDRQITWIWSQEGGVGKTTRQKRFTIVLGPAPGSVMRLMVARDLKQHAGASTAIIVASESSIDVPHTTAPPVLH